MEQGMNSLLFSPEELATVISHGMTLAVDAEVNDLLTFLHCIDCYMKFRQSELLNVAAFPKDLPNYGCQLLRILAEREMPRDRGDLERSLRFLADSNVSGLEAIPNMVPQRSVLRRFGDEHDPDAWKWLKYSIESVFEHEEMAHLRQAAALVAVRAYKWKAINFRPDDVDRFLQIAALPYLTNSALVYERREDGVLAHNYAFAYLVFAVLSAINSDLPKLNKMSVCFSHAYWDEFVSVLEREACKGLLNHRTTCQLLAVLCIISKQLTDRDQRYFVKPFGTSARSQTITKLQNYVSNV